MLAVKAFKEAYLTADFLDPTDFNDYDARKLRYLMYWAFFENTAYRNIHAWSQAFRRNYALYKWTRGVYNPTYRLAEFWKAHIWGGLIDPAAGDGEIIPSALPIETVETNTQSRALRMALAKVWRDSSWQINKDICTQFGALLGDVAIAVRDDPAKKRVWLQVVPPWMLKTIEVDVQGNVKSYELEEERVDPEDENKRVTYLETAGRNGQNVVYRTYRDGDLYAWNGQSQWSEPYGFVPFVIIQHNNVGMEWGWSEIHAAHGKIQELDDIASTLNDQVRKAVNAPFLLTGMAKKEDQIAMPTGTVTAARPEPEREESRFLYSSNTDAKAHSLMFPLDLEGVLLNIDHMLAEIERDYPELQMDIWGVQGTPPSARAMRQARQRIEIKISQRRPCYDDALVRAHKMAISIGGFGRYPGYEEFGLDSYERGVLDHTIGKRVIFGVDPLDDIEVQDAFWAAAFKATSSGMPLDVYLKREGWSEEEVSDVTSSEEYQMRIKLMKNEVASAAQQYQPKDIGGGIAQRPERE